MEGYKTYVHAPAHLFRPGESYILTAATYCRLPHLRLDERKRDWCASLGFVADREGWEVAAWVVLHNHYHVLMHAPETGADRLPRLVGDMHKFLAGRWNKADNTPGRQVWWNYWDTCITNERSFYARLNYIHWNPVRHGLAARPEDYVFSSYCKYVADLEQTVRRREAKYPWERVLVIDDF